MLSTAYRNLRCHQDKDALGPVNPKLRHLMDETYSFIHDSYNPAMRNEAAALLQVASDVKATRFNNKAIDTGDIKTKIGAAISKFRSLSISIYRLRTEADKVIEAARDRKQSLQCDIDSIQEDVRSKRKEHSNAKSTLSALENEISSKEKAAGELEEAAHSARSKGKKRKKRGLISVVVGVVAAPFTMGASLGVAALGLGEIRSADEAFSKAGDLRRIASNQRHDLPDLKSKLRDCEQEKNEVEKELSGLQKEQRVVQQFLGTVENVLRDLYNFETSLDGTVEKLTNFQGGLHAIKLHTDSLTIMQSIFSRFRTKALPPTAESLYMSYYRVWMDVESFLSRNKAIPVNMP